MINGRFEMNNASTGIFGATIVAIGTISAAIGASPLNFIKSNLRENLTLHGNVLQAGGNALQAEGQGDILRKVGKEFQAIGNTVVITGLVIYSKGETAQKLFIAGNWIQALGGFINVGHGLELNPFPGHVENIIGNLLQATGNSLQAIGGTYELEESKVNSEETYKVHITHNDEDSSHSAERIYESDKKYEDYLENNNEEPQSLIVTGSWIQAIGSVISLIGQIKETNYLLSDSKVVCSVFRLYTLYIFSLHNQHYQNQEPWGSMIPRVLGIYLFKIEGCKNKKLYFYFLYRLILCIFHL